MKNTGLDPIMALYKHADSRLLPDISTASIMAAVKASRQKRNLFAEIRQAFSLKWVVPAAVTACLLVVLVFVMFKGTPAKENMIAIDISAKSVIITADNSVLEQKSQEQELKFVYTSRNGKNVSVKL